MKHFAQLFPTQQKPKLSYTSNALLACSSDSLHNAPDLQAA